MNLNNAYLCIINLKTNHKNMKKQILSLVSLLAFSSVSAQQSVIFGDFNGDGKITVEDISHLVNISLGKEPMKEIKSTSIIEIIDYVNKYNGHGYVDLGFKDKNGNPIYWATCNIGADNPEDYGDYFAWGEFETKNDFSESLYFDKAYSLYNNNHLRTAIELEDDAANRLWGGTWRIPTFEELYELWDVNNCSWTWYANDNTEFNGIPGYKVQSKKEGYTENYIFLPASGYKEGTSCKELEISGAYWASTLRDNLSTQAKVVSFERLSHITYSMYRYLGVTIRPVFTESRTHEGYEYVDLGLKNANGQSICWATCNVGTTNPVNAGLYFAWGETEGYTCDTNDGRSFNWASYSDKICDGAYNKMKKYCTSSAYGIVDNKSQKYEKTTTISCSLAGNVWWIDGSESD